MAEIKKRTRKNGKITYTASIRIKGYRSMNATFDRLTDAKDWANEYESKMKRGKRIKDVEARKHTLSNLIDRYIQFELPQRKSDKEKFVSQLNWWKEKIGFYLLSDITSALLSEYKEILSTEPSIKPKNGKTTRSNATVNRYMACLSIVLSKAVKEWEWMEENPMFKVSKKKEPRGRVRYLTNKEVASLLKACKKSSEELYLLVLIALSTGARYGEIIKLTWDTIDLKNRTFHFLDTKNGEDRGVPIPNIVYDELINFSKVRKLNSILLFARKDGKKALFMKKGFRNSIEKCGIDDFTFHDLRHTAASYLAMNNASLLEIAEILGHKTLAMVKRYSHLTQKHTADLLERMNDSQFANIELI